jgi:hypothetical protein
MAEDGCVSSITVNNLEIVDQLYLENLVITTLNINKDCKLDQVIIHGDLESKFSNSFSNGSINISGHTNISNGTVEFKNNLNIHGNSTFNGKVDISGCLIDLSGFEITDTLSMIGDTGNILIRQTTDDEPNKNAIHFLYPDASIGDVSNAYIGYKYDTEHEQFDNNKGVIFINGNLRVKNKILNNSPSNIDISGGIIYLGINNSTTFHGNIGFLGQIINNSNRQFYGLIFDNSGNNEETDKFVLFKDLSGSEINSTNFTISPNPPNNQIDVNNSNSLEYAELLLGDLSITRKDNDGKLDISGIIDLSGSMKVNNGKIGINISNQENINGLLDVSGILVINDNGIVNFNNDTNIAKMTINNNLDVSGKTVLQETDISGHLDASGVTISNKLDVIERVNLQKTNITQKLDTSGMTINESFSVENTDIVLDNLTIKQDMSANNLLIYQDSDVSGNTILNGKVDISGNLDVSGVNIKGNLNVSGVTIFTSDINIKNNKKLLLTNGSRSNINGNFNIKGSNLFISGGTSGEYLKYNGSGLSFVNHGVIDASGEVTDGNSNGYEITELFGYKTFEFKYINNSIKTYTFNITHAGLVEVLVVGGGGAGGKNAQNTKGGGGGGGGEVINKVYNFPIGTYLIEVGNGAISSNNTDTSGGPSSITKNDDTSKRIIASGGLTSEEGNPFSGGGIGGNSGNDNSGGDPSSGATAAGGGGGGAGGDGEDGGDNGGGEGGIGGIGGRYGGGGGGGGGQGIGSIAAPGFGGNGGGGDGGGYGSEISGKDGDPHTGGGGGGGGAGGGAGGNGGSGTVTLTFREIGFDNLFHTYP